MNENINLTKILKNCPKGTKLYSIIHGEVEYAGINDNSLYRVEFETKNKDICGVTSDGRHLSYFNGECILFPSKDQRDWSKFTAPWYKKEKFDPKTLQPFDKILARNVHSENWNCDIFSNINDNEPYKYNTISNYWKYCIPYNDETKHLVGTNEEAPEYYRYWED